MIIRLQNIGIVKDSTICLDGLTVITGQNNSGKTTVGKVVYSLLDAVTNIRNKAQNDKLNYIQKKLDEIESTLEIFRFIRRSGRENISELFGESSVLSFLFGRSYKHEVSRGELEQFAHKIYGELNEFDIDSIAMNKEFFRYSSRLISKTDDPIVLADTIREQINKTLVILDKLFEDLDNDPDLIDYARESISQTLRVEFANQIQPVSKNVKFSKVELIQNDSVCFNFEIKENKIVDNGKPVFISVPYKRAYFIDDPFILDELPIRRYFREQDVENGESFLNTERILTHDNMLKFVLKNNKAPTIFEETVLNNALEEIKKQIAHVIPGEFEFNSEGEYYVQNGSKLKISNLATGSKMFSILKILLEKGEISDTTMLILDEPEAHLHPNWQNKFAEIIVLLVKELNANILLTTHSSNFMLAIDAYMRKHDISSKTNFYQTEYMKDGFVEYQCVNNDMGKIYADFMQYLSEVKILKDSFTER